MSITVITRGASGGGLTTILDVTAPVGSTVTARKILAPDVYGEPITAQYINGVYRFTGLALGSYLVTATKDGKTASTEVLMDVVGMYSVELQYETWLYRDGEEFVDLTGGWSRSWIESSTYPATFTKNPSSMFIQTYQRAATQYVYYGGCASSVSAIDVSKYNTMHIILDTSPMRLTGGELSFGLKATYTESLKLGTNVFTSVNGTLTDFEAVCDISEVSGMKYPSFQIGGNGQNATIKAIWLE